MRASGPFVRSLTEILHGQSDHCFLDVVPSECVEEALAEAGKSKDRLNARLPRRLVLALVYSLALFRDKSMGAVLLMTAGVVGAPPCWHGSLPPASSISDALVGLGWQVVRAVFRRFCQWIFQSGALSATWRGLRPAALDGTNWRVPDTEANVAEFGRPGSRKGPAGYPQIRCVAVVDTLTHLVLAAAWGSCRGTGSSELSLAAKGLLDQLKRSWVVLMDRGFCSYRWFRELLGRGIPFVARLKTGKNSVLPRKLSTLKRGKDWLVSFPVPNSLRPRSGAVPLTGLRLLRLHRKGYRPVLLLTNLCDEDKYSYEDLLELYAQRWEIEFAFREIKVDLIQAKLQFRTKNPERIKVEAYGLLIAYNAIRYRIACAAKKAGLEPRKLSFALCLFALELAYLLPVSVDQLLDFMAKSVLQERPPRSFPRVVKMPASKFAASRARAKAS